MTRLMIVVASVREGRIGLPIAQWVRGRAQADPRFDIDWADLKEIDLPMMNEPNHPKMRKYTHEHTKQWSARVDAADAFIFVQPEYNHSFAPALKNALDYLFEEWGRKPVGTVSYGGISGGTRGTTSIRPTELVLGLVPTRANLELAWAAKQVADDRATDDPAADDPAADDRATDDRVFEPADGQNDAIDSMLDELATLHATLSPLRD